MSWFTEALCLTWECAIDHDVEKSAHSAGSPTQYSKLACHESWCMMQIIATVHVVELEYLHRNHPHFRSAQYLNSTLPFHNAFATFYCCPCPSQKILHSRHGVSALSDFHCQSLLAADSQEHQLSSYHFIFSRFWKNECIHCSILLNVILAHIAQ